MKYLTSCLALVVAASFSVHAESNDDVKSVHTIIPGKEKIKQINAKKARTDNLYYVVLHDEPLASYQGGVAGLSATSSANNGAFNKTAKGTLNVKSAASRQYLNYLSGKQANFKTAASRLLKRSLNAKHDYQIVLNAIATELTDNEAELLKRHSSVKSVEKIGMHYIQTSSGPEFIGSKQVWNGIAEHAGNQGEGVVVGIIDTGINARHPSFADVGADGYDHDNPLGKDVYLGDCQQHPQFCNDKLIGIVSYDSITDGYPAPTNSDFEDLEIKMDIGYDFNGHGSHVASTAAGNILHDVSYYLSVQDDEGVISGKSDFVFNDISGVAPHANIVSYQVCNDAGCYPELTVEALEHAIENGVNIINYSVGGSAGNPWSAPDSLAFLNAREAGIHIATSAGNSGPGAETIGGPGNSPWITTVAAYSHDRGFSEKTLNNFTGGDTTAPAEMTGKAATSGIQARIVLAGDFGDAQCLTPFPANTFNGEIVVCERGQIARVRKGLNVKEGGAGGLVLINTEENASVNADNHLLPAIHLDKNDGEALVTWLSSGSNHQASIGSSDMIRDSELGDIAGVFTSRGPNRPYSEIFSPDISAPGVQVYAAYAEDKPFNEDAGGIPYTTMDGTSMASPHVAGAMALLHAAHPDWSPAQMQSAIMTTAHRETFKDDEFSGEKQRSDFFDGGAGSIRVNQAINAGLLLDISKQEYLEANPNLGGDPKTLNSSSMVNNLCISSCSWTRTVTATTHGTWEASYEYLNPGFSLSVTPANFTLAKGQSQTLTITADANINLADEWVHGYVVLNNKTGNVSDSHLQATIGFKAGLIADSVEATLNNIDNKLIIGDVKTTGSNDLQTQGFGLFKAESFEGSAIGASNDNERSSPAENTATLFAQKITVKPYTKRLIAEITDSSAPDMDLFVGIDEDNNGLPSYIELYYSTVCISGELDSNEKCIVERPPVGEYWVFAHNFEGTNAGEADDVTIRITQIPYTNVPSFDINSPEQVEKDHVFDVELTVNGALDEQEALMPLEADAVYYGLLEMGTTDSLKRNVGGTLLKVTGKEPVKVNHAPIVANPVANHQVQLDDTNRASVVLDVSQVFFDEDNDDLALTVESDSTSELIDQQLTVSFDNTGTYQVTIAANDGQLSAATTFEIEVLAAAVTPQPEPEPEHEQPSSSGGAISLLFSLLSLLSMRRVRS